MKILYIRTNDTTFDSRATKEIETIRKSKENELTVLGWNRDGKNTKKVYKDETVSYDRYLVDIFAPWGRGGKANFFPLFLFMKTIKKWVKKNIDRFDIIHCVDLPTAYYIAPIAHKHNKKVVYDIFDYFPDLKRYPKIIRNFFVHCENKTIKKSDVLILCTKERAKQIGKAKYNKLEIIYNSPNFENYPLLSGPFSQISFCYVGNLSEERNISFVLKFFKKHPEYILHIGGIGNLEQKVKEYSGKYNNIIFYGPMKYDDVLKLESKCNILIAFYDPEIPNHRYVAPNKFYESLALGKQLIAFKNTGLDQAFNNNHFGVLIDKSIESFEDGVNFLISEQDKWIEYGRIQQQLFNEEYSWKIMEQKLLNIYKELKKGETND